MKIKFGIRKSRLARIQLDELLAYLESRKVKIEPEVVTMSTTGDMADCRSIEKTGAGIFTKELERALLDGEIDCAVHSLKDVQVDIDKGTVLSCFAPRQDVRDCLVARNGVDSGRLDGLRIGTGSPRRSAFLKEVERGVRTLPVRGNVDTRVRKTDEGECDAVLLAACGLKRLGLEKRITRYFDPESFIPAAGQGAICAQTRVRDTELNRTFNHASSVDTAFACLAERRVLKHLGIGCQTPFGVYASFSGDLFAIRAKLYREEEGDYVFNRMVSKRDGSDKATEGLIADMKAAMGRER